MAATCCSFTQSSSGFRKLHENIQLQSYFTRQVVPSSLCWLENCFCNNYCVEENVLVGFSGTSKDQLAVLKISSIGTMEEGFYKLKDGINISICYVQEELSCPLLPMKKLERRLRRISQRKRWFGEPSSCQFTLLHLFLSLWESELFMLSMSR